MKAVYTLRHASRRLLSPSSLRHVAPRATGLLRVGIQYRWLSDNPESEWQNFEAQPVAKTSPLQWENQWSTSLDAAYPLEPGTRPNLPEGQQSSPPAIKRPKRRPRRSIPVVPDSPDAWNDRPEEPWAEPTLTRPERLAPIEFDPRLQLGYAVANTNRRSQYLKPGDRLKIVSWNLDGFAPDPFTRANAALIDIARKFGRRPERTVLLFQEVRRSSLEAIKDSLWIKSNFLMPDHIEGDRVLTSEIRKRTESDQEENIKTRKDFSVILVSRDIPILNFFRTPFVSTNRSEILGVDIPVDRWDGTGELTTEAIRICTGHLGPITFPRYYDPETMEEGPPTPELKQLEAVSVVQNTVTTDFISNPDRNPYNPNTIPRGPSNYKIIGGLSGGYFDTMKPQDHRNFHKQEKINLNDVWSDERMTPAVKEQMLLRAAERPFSFDPTYGREYGITYGYQPVKSRTNSNTNSYDKFYYTGNVKPFALEEHSQDVTGVLGRIGVGLSTMVSVNVYKAVRQSRRWTAGLSEFQKKNFEGEKLSEDLLARRRKFLTGRTGDDAWAERRPDFRRRTMREGRDEYTKKPIYDAGEDQEILFPTRPDEDLSLKSSIENHTPRRERDEAYSGNTDANQGLSIRRIAAGASDDAVNTWAKAHEEWVAQPSISNYGAPATRRSEESWVMKLTGTKKERAWVSDHFGITVGIEIAPPSGEKQSEGVTSSTLPTLERREDFKE